MQKIRADLVVLEWPADLSSHIEGGSVDCAHVDHERLPGEAAP